MKTIEKFGWTIPLLLFGVALALGPRDLRLWIFGGVLVLVAEIVIVRFRWLQKNDPAPISAARTAIKWTGLAYMAFVLAWRLIAGVFPPTGFLEAVTAIAVAVILVMVMRRSSTKEQA
jgi:hypothetical protein